MPDLWTPVPEMPHEAFVERIYRAIASFAEATGVEKPVVEVELADTSHFVLDRIEPEPGFGMVTLYVTDERDDAPDALIVPIGSLRRIELRTAPEKSESFGLSRLINTADEMMRSGDRGADAAVARSPVSRRVRQAM